MKNYIFLFFLFTTFSTVAQTEQFIGEYQLASPYNINNEVLTRVLSINNDNTFSFHEYQNSKEMISPKNSYGKGTWTAKGNYIYFHAQKNDIIDQYTLNFDNSKAVYKSKHPRDKSDRIIIPYLLFLKTDIFWMERVKLEKK